MPASSAAALSLPGGGLLFSLGKRRSKSRRQPGCLLHRWTYAVGSLVVSHPYLLDRPALHNPGKTLDLLWHADIEALHGLLSAVPPEILSPILAALLEAMPRERVAAALAPLVGSVELQSAVAALLPLVSPEDVVLLIRDVPTQNVAAVLSAPVAVLTAALQPVRSGRVRSSILPMLQEPLQLIQGTLLPVLRTTTRPERLGALANFVEPWLLLTVFRVMTAERLVDLLDSVADEDLEPGGSVLELLACCAREPDLLYEKGLPLLQRGTISKIVPFVQRVPLDQLLAVLRGTDADGAVRLVEHANASLVATAASLNLDRTLVFVAGCLGSALASPSVAQVVAGTTDAIGSSVDTANSVIDGGLDVLGSTVLRTTSAASGSS